MTTAETIAVTAEIPKTRIADLLCCGFEGPFTRMWCRIYSQHKPRKPRAYVSPEDGKIFPHCDYPLAAGGALLVYETEQLTDADVARDRSKLLRLDLNAIRRGLDLMPKVAPRQWGNFLARQEDGVTGDVFVQLCVLGELRYS